MVQATFETRPDNVCAVVGDTVELMCSIQGDLLQLWKKGPANYISENDQLDEDYEGIYQIFGQYNLRILDIAYDEAGLYTCEDSSQLKPEKYASSEVIVLGLCVLLSRV